MRVVVYKNLTRGCWSIAAATPTNGRGKLIGHADTVTLCDVQFVVRESRRLAITSARCAEKPCREVHAWAVGTLADAPEGTRNEVTYNPYRAPTFTLRDGTPVRSAACVTFTDRAYLIQESTP